MATHNSGGSLHQASGGLGPIFTVPTTGVYWIDGEGDATITLVLASSGALVATTGGTATLTAGTQYQFKASNVSPGARSAGGRVVMYNGNGGER